MTDWKRLAGPLRRHLVLLLFAALLAALILPRIYARVRAEQYMQEKYGGFIAVDEVDYTRVKLSLRDRTMTVRAVYDGVEFGVHLHAGSDDFVWTYLEQAYADRIGGGEAVSRHAGSCSVHLYQYPETALELQRTDHAFRATISYGQDAFSTAEEFAAAVAQAAGSLEQLGLTGCDSLSAIWHTDGANSLRLDVDPQRDENPEELAAAVYAFPKEDPIE